MLLLHLVINITFSVYSLFSIFFITVDMLFFNNIIVSVEIIFFCLFQGLNSPANTFFFNKSISSKGHLVNNFVPYSDLSMYDLLAITTYFVYRVQIQRCFDVERLYPMRILFQTFQ